MGYMTEFHFQCDCTDEKRMEQIVKEMRELQIVPYVFSEDLENYDPCTWYTEEKDMRALSLTFRMCISSSAHSGRSTTTFGRRTTWAASASSARQRFGFQNLIRKNWPERHTSACAML